MNIIITTLAIFALLHNIMNATAVMLEHAVIDPVSVVDYAEMAEGNDIEVAHK